MTRNVADLLVVYVLGKEVGLTRLVNGRMTCALPVVPLFETFEDLEAAPGILAEFLSYPSAQASLQKVGGEPNQVIMLGYSDSATVPRAPKKVARNSVSPIRARALARSSAPTALATSGTITVGRNEIRKKKVLKT